MSAIASGNILRVYSLVLGLINVLQPISRDSLITELRDHNKDDIEESLQFLVSRKMILDLPNDMYRTTWLGQKSLRSTIITKKLDIHRMWHLSDLSDKQRRRGEKGEPHSGGR